MTQSTSPFFVVYVVWHPAFEQGAVIANRIFEHFRRRLFESVVGGTGLSVLFRSAPAIGADRPLQIDFDDADTTAVVVLADSNLSSDAGWAEYVRDIANTTNDRGLETRLFPVFVDASAIRLNLSEQALRWDSWLGSDSDRCLRLLNELTYEFCRMLRHTLECLKRPDEDLEQIDGYLRKVQVFLSHSKHDEHGEAIARSIRERVQSATALSTFLDVHDIPAGMRFSEVLLRQVRVSAMVAIHTDSYSSREWCRREIIEAKRWNVPLVIVNSITELDERGFPYMGNVPIVRLDPGGQDRIEMVVGRLLDEVLKDFLWQCRVMKLQHPHSTNVVFLPRPPELISLVNLNTSRPTIVYPDPPLSAEEEFLFKKISPNSRLQSITQWIALRRP